MYNFEMSPGAAVPVQQALLFSNAAIDYTG
jgi:hypothetical protein